MRVVPEDRTISLHGDMPSDKSRPSAEDFEALCAVQATRIPIERPDLFLRIKRALGFDDAPKVHNPPRPPGHRPYA